MADILRQAGFRGQAYELAKAVMMAESHGNPLAHNTNAGTGDNSYGEFQINMLGALGPDRIKRYGLKSNNDLFDPLTNAKVAYQMSKGGTDWSPWSTYKSGAYKSYLGKSASIPAGPQGSGQRSAGPQVQGSSANPGGDPTSTRSNALMQYALAQSSALLQGNTEGSGSLLSFLQNLPSDVATPKGNVSSPANSASAPPGASLSKGVSGKLKLVPTQWDTKPGIQVNSAILPSVTNIARQFGVKVNSGYRSAEHNAAVGGASHSDHLGGNAVDFTGSPDQMHKLYNWAQGRFPYVEPWDQSGGNHVHISFIR